MSVLTELPGTGEILASDAGAYGVDFTSAEYSYEVTDEDMVEVPAQNPEESEVERV